MSAFDFTIIISIAASILYLLTAGIALKRRGFRERPARLLVIYATVLCLLELGRAFLRPSWLAPPADTIWAQVMLYGVFVLALLFLHLSRSFLRLEGAGWGWWVLGVVWMVALVVLDSNLLALPDVLWLGNGWLVGRQALAFDALVLGWAIFTGGATLLTLMAYRQTHQPLHRNRIAYWSLALIFTITGAALIFARREPLSSLFYMLSTLSAAYVVLIHRLLDVRRMARRTTSYLIVTPLTVVIYTAGFMAAQYLFQAMPGYSPWLAGVAMALVMALLFDPLLHLVQRFVSRLISGAGRDPGRMLHEYSTSISNILDLERLATVAVGFVSEAMGIQRGALFVVHYEGGETEWQSGYFHLRGVTGMGEKDPPPGILPAESPVVSHLCHEHRPLTQYDIDLHPSFRETAQTERTWLASLGMDVYVPIYAKGEWIGLLALGPKTSGDRYFDDDMVLLSTLADQTALALENARLFDDLKARTVEIEQLNEDLAEANRELAWVGQVKSDFIDIASHELRTPLTQVRGYTDILREMVENESLNPDKGGRLIPGLKEAAQRLEEIVDTMFDVAQIDTATLHLDLLPTSVAQTVSAVMDTWATALEKRGQTLTVEGLADLPTITADCKRLDQVFSQLIQNAIKYTPDDGQIQVTGHLLGEGMPPEDQSIEVVVADTGIGIAPDDLERIFEKFYRVGDVLLHSTGKFKFKGAGPGLGLTIARGIVEAHGGRIWAESPGHDEETYLGSEFHVVLPVQPRLLES